MGIKVIFTEISQDSTGQYFCLFKTSKGVFHQKLTPGIPETIKEDQEKRAKAEEKRLEAAAKEKEMDLEMAKQFKKNHEKMMKDLGKQNDNTVKIIKRKFGLYKDE